MARIVSNITDQANDPALLNSNLLRLGVSLGVLGRLTRGQETVSNGAPVGRDGKQANGGPYLSPGAPVHRRTLFFHFPP